MADDFLFMGMIGSGRDDFNWYFSRHQGHIMPLSFFLVKIMSIFGPFNWMAVTIQILFLQAITYASGWWMLRVLFGNQAGILPIFTFFVFVPLTMPTVMWWAVAINQLPFMFGLFGLFASHTEYLRSPKIRWFILANVFLGIAALSYLKTPVALIVVFLYTVLYFGEGRLSKRLWSSATRFWPLWLSYAAWSILLLYLFLREQSERLELGVNNLSLVPLSLQQLFSTLIPLSLGGPIRWDSRFPNGSPTVIVSDAGSTFIVVSSLILMALLAYIMLTRSRAIIAILIPGAYLLFSVVLLFLEREWFIAFLGIETIGSFPQYLSDTTPLIAIAIGLATLHLQGANRSSAERSRRLTTFRIGKRRAAALTFGIVVLSVISSIRYADYFHKPWPQRQVMATAVSEIQEIEPIIAPSLTPVEWGMAIWFPFNSVDTIFSPISDSFELSENSPDLKTLDLKGRLIPARVNADDRAIGEEINGTCRFEITEKSTKIRLVPTPAAQFWMQIDYTTQSDTVAKIDYGDAHRYVELRKGSGSAVFSTSGEISSIRIRPLTGSRICVSSVRIGRLKGIDSG